MKRMTELTPAKTKKGGLDVSSKSCCESESSSCHRQLQFCPSCESMHCSGDCDEANQNQTTQTCSICNTAIDISSIRNSESCVLAPFDTCNKCDKIACHTCASSTFFDCEYCDRHLCGNCTSNVPCEGSRCKMTNCMECAENGNGDVLSCCHCGRGFCTGIKSMEFCFCLEGHACPECHCEMHDYDVECYWRHLPSEMQQIVADFATVADMSEESFTEFWQECSQFLPADKDFDLRQYRRTRRARAASLILASYRLLKGQDKEAVYMVLYAALLEEAWNRGTTYVKNALENCEQDEEPTESDEPTTQVLAIYFTSFHSVIENTVTKANIIALLHNQLPSIREKEGRKLFECIDFALGKMQKTKSNNTPIHSIPILSSEDYEKEMRGKHYGDSLSMNIITSNMDNETKQKNFVYKDMSLGWWLKIFVIKSSYHQWLSTPVSPSTNCFRVLHQGKTILLNSAGTKTLHQLGIKDGDEIVIEGVDAEETSSHSSESKTCDIMNTCSVCKVTGQDNGGDSSVLFDVCHGCETVACDNCSSSFFDCDYCDRLLCGNCVSDIPCEGSDCDMTNCMECAENGDGDVLYCTNCGRGFCTGCRAMEFCFCLVGDTCPECHSECHHHDVECYRQILPTEVQELLANSRLESMSEDSIVSFWQECIEFFPPDKDFDLYHYRKTRQTRAASLIAASDHLLKGQENEAVYLILYAALIEEVWNRGTNYVKKVLLEMEDAKILGIYFTSFHSVMENTTTQANMIAHLHSQLPSIHEKEGKELLKCMDFAMGKLSRSNSPIHSSPIITAEDYEEELSCRNFEDSLTMDITTSNMDSGRKEEGTFYKDLTLGWWLKIFVIKSSYQNWLRNPEIPPSTKPTKYFRVVHQGKTIFLSSAGKKTLHQLGIREGDEIVVGGVEPEESNAQGHGSNASSKKEGKKNKKSKKKSGGKKKKKSQPLIPTLTEEQLMEKYRQEHSQTMTPVFEDLGPLLKEIRNRLNDLTIKKSAPKVRRRKITKKKSQPAEQSLPADDITCSCGKAGKTSYPILVGEVTGLYKTSKHLAKTPIVIDLHGLFREEAMQKLDESLPIWVNTAMRGEYPWVIPVDIICGGGSQILSEVVQNWIRTNRRVANRPKGFV